MRSTLVAALLVGPATAGSPVLAQDPPAPDPTAGELIMTALERYWARMEQVDDFLVVQKTSGFETRSYYEKHMIDGKPVFFLDGRGANDENRPADPYAVFPELAGRARLDGTEQVEGRSCWVLRVDDLTGVNFPGFSSTRSPAFEPRRTALYLDRDELILRRITLSGELDREGTAYPLTVDARMQDFQEVDGVLYPWRTVMAVEGLGAAISPEERREAEEALGQLHDRLETMPGSQRRMLENALSEQIERLESILGSGGTELVTEVVELRVNAGRPGS